MEYTIKKVAQLAGVSPRTLRYYDEIGLLKPTRINSSGYRIYGEDALDMLQQILFYRSLDFSLTDIQQIMQEPTFSIEQALTEHYQQLLHKRNQIDQLLHTLEKTMRYQKGELTMTNQEKFEAFKQEKLQENEQTFGKEIREKYGEAAVQNANQNWLNLSQADVAKMEQTEKDLFAALHIVLETQDLHSEAAKTVYNKHKEWLQFSWSNYSATMHKNLADMYVADPRFTAYYDTRVQAGSTQLLRQIIQHYAIT